MDARCDSMQPITSARLDLVPATIAHLEAELNSPEELGRFLGAVVPSSWPPGEYDRAAMEFFRDRLSGNPALVGWYGWYAIHRAESDGPTVIGAAGYLGPPGSDGTVEVGYSIAQEFRGRGYATEIVEALVRQAFSFPEVTRVIAHTQTSNSGSVKVLRRCGFTLVGLDDESGAFEYERLQPIT